MRSECVQATSACYYQQGQSGYYIIDIIDILYLAVFDNCPLQSMHGSASAGKFRLFALNNISLIMLDQVRAYAMIAS